MIRRIAQHRYVPDLSHEWLMVTTIFLLMIINFLQVGMIAFAASPLMGELGVSPQEYSLTSAAYAAVAIVTISKQRWLVERMGWKRYILTSILIFFLGCSVCFSSRNFSQFLIGHVTMGVGGAAFMSGARTMITLLPAGPLRFKGLKGYVYGLTIGMALSPFLSACLFIYASWNYLFLVLLGLCILAAASASFCLPGIPPKEALRSQSHPYFLMALATGSFLTLYALDSGSYEFYSNTILVSVILLLGLTSIYYFFRSMIRHQHAAPLLSMKPLLDNKRFRSGILVFFLCYLIMGSNSYFLPQVLEKGLGFGWGTVGTWYSLGLTSMVIGAWVQLKCLPKSPNGKKYFLIGFSCICAYGYLMSRLSSSTDIQTYILPCIVLYGVFGIFLQATAAAKTFGELENNEVMFSHGQQFKNMISQIGQSMGVALASIGLQWRTTVHYDLLNDRVTSHNPIYQKTLAQVADQYAKHTDSVVAQKIAFSWIESLLNEQSILLAGIDYFTLLFFVGIIGFVIMLIQKRLN
ncbi:MFS transporter [Marinomonas pollencensis]|nr:MFS transporter [Marinomonas pollencensis]